MKKGRLLAGWLLLVLVTLSCGMSVFAAEAKVFDQAGMFGSEETAALQKKAKEIEAQYDMNIIVVTTEDAQGKEAREYADDFYMEQGFYDNGAKGGVLYLLDMDNREVYVATQGDMRYYITDDRNEAVIDAGYDQIADGNYYKGIQNMLDQTAEWLKQGIEADQYMYDEDTGKIVKYHSLQPFEWGAAAVISLLAAAAVCAGVIGKYRLKWGGYKYPYKEKSSVHLIRREDRFMNQIVTTRRIPKNPPPSSGGGGGGGRTTIHTSSGGGSFGGGGRKF